MPVQQKTRLTVLILGLMTPGTLAYTPANAEILPPPDWISYSHDPQSNKEGRFVVKLDQDGNWTKLKKSSTKWTVRLHMNGGNENHLKIVKFYVKPSHNDPGWGSSYGALKYTVSGSEHTSMYQTLRAGDPAVLELSANVGETFAQLSTLKTPQQICHDHRENLLSQGTNLYTILSNDWVVEKTAFSQARTDFKIPLATSGYANWSYLPWVNLPVKVKCKGDVAIAAKVAPLVATLDPNALPKVDNASLTLIEQYGVSGMCKVKLSGVVQTNFKDTKVRFRYEHASGKKSEIHEVTTDHAKTAMFAHKYDIPVEEGPEGGSIRIIGVQPTFETGWKSYAMDCVKPAATGFTAVLPPKVSMDVVTEETTMVDGQICPSKLRLIGRLEGRGDFEGQVAFVGDNYLSKPESYDISDGENKFIVAFRDLKWNGPSGPSFQTTAPDTSKKRRKQTIQLGLNVTGPSNTVIASVPKTPKKIKCKFPKINAEIKGGSDEMTVAPRP